MKRTLPKKSSSCKVSYQTFILFSYFKNLFHSYWLNTSKLNFFFWIKIFSFVRNSVFSFVNASSCNEERANTFSHAVMNDIALGFDPWWTLRNNLKHNLKRLWFKFWIHIHANDGLLTVWRLSKHSFVSILKLVAIHGLYIALWPFVFLKLKY